MRGSLRSTFTAHSINLRMSQPKFVEKIKTNTLNSFFSRKSCRLGENVEKRDTAREFAEDNVIWRLRSACQINKARI